MSVARVLEGVMVPVTTPFTGTEAIDEQAFVAQLEWVAAQGAHGVVVGGSTGEGFALNEREMVRLVELATNAVGAKIPILAGIIADSTGAAALRARLLAGSGIAALQVAPPHYIFTPSDAGLIEFYKTLAETISVPVIIYNVIPWANVSPALAKEIMRAVPGVVAIKQSGTDLGVYADLIRSVGPERVFAAIDGALMSCYDLGAAGSIAAIASAIPRANVMLWNAVRAGRREEAMRLHRQILEVWIALKGPNLPAKVKAAQALQGLHSGHARAPMAAASAAERALIAKAIDGLK